MTRWKAVPWILGVALLAVSLVAARLNSPGSSANGDKPAPSSGSVVGPTVVGTVGTIPDVLPLFPPGVPGMASLTVKKVHVKPGAAVQPGDVLVEFDSSTFAEQKVQAEHAVTEAEWTAEQARKKGELHAQDVDRMKLGVKKATEDNETAKLARDTVKDVLERTFKVPDFDSKLPLTEEQKALRRKENLDLQKAEAAVRLSEIGVENAKAAEKQAVESKPLLEADLNKANAAVARFKSAAAGATALLESFKLKAQVAGTIEQISVAEGVAVGPTTRTPLMYLIPAGPRVVWAEVEAEFAHKIEPFLGKPVTITDSHNFNNTYSGVARRVSGAFLPKRFGSDSLVTNPTRSLECVIDVTDPAPAGKPPLRPGQPVRVTFGQ
jgi:multidrug resistance efflux pump